MNNNASTTERCSRIRSVCGVHHVVVNNAVALVLVPDLDSKLVHSTAAVDLTVPSGQLEAVAAGPIHCASAAIPGLGTRDDQPLIGRALKVEIGHLELELGVTGRNAVPILVLGLEPKVGLTCERWVGCIRASW